MSSLTSTRTPIGSKPRSEILLALRPDGSGLTVVGDDAQSIYSFRAATVRNILDFPHHFSPPATVIALEHNYRSTQPILDAANAVIAGASEKIAKTLYSTKASAERPFLANVEDETAQAKYVADSNARFGGEVERNVSGTTTFFFGAVCCRVPPRQLQYRTRSQKVLRLTALSSPCRDGHLDLDPCAGSSAN